MFKPVLTLTAALSFLLLTACSASETTNDQPKADNAAAPSWTDYSQAAFVTAQENGRTIVVDVYADWCPTCKAQAPILDELRNEDTLAEAAFFKVDYDAHKDFLKAHRIPRQSTILVFKGDEEVARSIAETDRERLRMAVLDAA